MPDAGARNHRRERALRFAVRTARLLPHIVAGLLLAVVVRVVGGRRLQPEPLMRWWSRRVLRILAVEVQVDGRLPDGGHLVVANHVSWLDIPVLSACVPARFISKSEVRNWPVAGLLATASGTFFLRRGKGGARPLLDRLVPFLKSGGSVVLYPEGTTTGGDDVLPFHSRLFAAAVESQLPIQPVALCYGRGDGGAAIAPFVGDDDLVSHVVRLLFNRRLVVRIVFCESMAVRGQPREVLAQTSRDRIRTALRPGYDRDLDDAPEAANHRQLAA